MTSQPATPDARHATNRTRARTLRAVGGALALLAVLLLAAGAFAVADSGDHRTGFLGVIAFTGFGFFAWSALRDAGVFDTPAAPAVDDTTDTGAR